MSAQLEMPVVFTPPSTIEAQPDVALQSGDGKLLLAHKSYLESAFEGLQAMFSMTRNSAGDEQLPHIPFSESSTTLALLLSYIYPGTRRRPDTFLAFQDALVAAEKYSVHCVLDNLGLCLSWPPYLDEHPLGVYAAAQHLKLEFEASLALERLCSLPFDHHLLQKPDGVSGTHVIAVNRARKEKTELLLSTIKGALGHSDTYYDPLNGYFCRPYCRTREESPAWLKHWLETIRADLLEQPVLGASFCFRVVESLRLASPKCPCGAEHTWNPSDFENFKMTVENGLKGPPRVQAV